jgi:hypothetical protein
MCLGPVMLHKVQMHTLNECVEVVAAIGVKNCGLELLSKCAVDALDDCVCRWIFYCGWLAFDSIAL